VISKRRSYYSSHCAVVPTIQTKMSLATAEIYCTTSPRHSAVMENCSVVQGPAAANALSAKVLGMDRRHALIPWDVWGQFSELSKQQLSFDVHKIWYDCEDLISHHHHIYSPIITPPKKITKIAIQSEGCQRSLTALWLAAQVKK